jgi:hypothetical protein
MTFEKTPISREVSKTAVDKALDELFNVAPSRKIIWRMIKRHRFGLMTSYAVVISIVVFVPFLPGLLLSYIVR